MPILPPTAPVEAVANLPLERLSAEFGQALGEALRIATDRRDGYMGSEHVLLAVLGQPDCAGARALRSLGVTEDAVRKTLDRALGARDSRSEASPVDTTRVRNAVVRSISSQAEPGLIDTIVLIGAAIDSGGVGGLLLRDLGITGDRWNAACAGLAPERPESAAGSVSPSLAGLWIQRGYARLMLERADEARSDFATALGAATTDSLIGIAANDLAWTDLYLGDQSRFTEALGLAERAREKLPQEPNVRGTLAYALIENGRLAEGVETLASIGVQGRDDRTTAERALILALGATQIGNRQFAEVLLEIAQQLLPDSRLVARVREGLAGSSSGEPLATPAVPDGAVTASVQSIRLHRKSRKYAVAMKGGDQRIFAIWLDASHADRIVRLLSPSPAPLTGGREWLELVLSRLESRGERIRSVFLDRLVDGEYRGAALVSGNPDWAFTVRPADAAVIALLARLPVRISRELWNQYALNDPARQSLLRRIAAVFNRR